MTHHTTYLFLFQNIRAVIKVEKWCIDNNIEHRVIPVPRQFSSECGMCIEVESDTQPLTTYLASGNIAFRQEPV